MSSFRFYLFSTLTFITVPLVGFYTGVYVFYDFLTRRFGNPSGTDVLSFSAFTAIFAIFAFFVGILISFIVVHKMGKRWGKDLAFGSHPVLKLTTLSFISSVVFLIIILNINYYFNK